MLQLCGIDCLLGKAESVILLWVVQYVRAPARKAWITSIPGMSEREHKHRTSTEGTPNGIFVEPDNHSFTAHFDSPTTGGLNWLSVWTYVPVIQMREQSWTTLWILKARVCLCTAQAVAQNRLMQCAYELIQQKCDNAYHYSSRFLNI